MTDLVVHYVNARPVIFTLKKCPTLRAMCYKRTLNVGVNRGNRY